MGLIILSCMHECFFLACLFEGSLTVYLFVKKIHWLIIKQQILACLYVCVHVCICIVDLVNLFARKLLAHNLTANMALQRTDHGKNIGYQLQIVV